MKLLEMTKSYSENKINNKLTSQFFSSIKSFNELKLFAIKLFLLPNK